MDLFKRNGFQNVSVEDIARECKISKATLYKFFSSKESLVCEAIKVTTENFSNEIRTIDSTEVDGLDKLKKKLIVIWNQIFTQTMYNRYITENFDIKKLADEVKIQIETRSSIVDEYRRAIIESYGEEIKDNIWDLIFCVDAVMHEFVFIVRTRHIDIDEEYIANYALLMLELVVSHRDKFQIIKKEYLNYESDKEQEIRSKEQLLKALNNLKYTIESKKPYNSKAKEAYDIIYNKIKCLEYDSIIIDGMVAILEKEDYLKNHMININNLRNRIIKEKNNGI